MSDERGLIVRPEAALQLALEFDIPDTPEDLVASMNVLGAGLHAAGWATAALVYAWTESAPGRRTDLGEKPPRWSFKDFARLGFRGLRDRHTVAAYYNAWAVAVELEWAPEVLPGDHVRVPEQDFDLAIVRPKRPAAETPDLPPGTYRTIVADPPWDVMAGSGFAKGAVSRPLEYPSMSVEDIAALPIAGLAAEDAHLYLWTINAYIPEAYEIVEAWGFEPSTLLTWCKSPGRGLGGAYALTTEHILFARRGSLAATERIMSSWFDWPRTRAHSIKPDGFFQMVERVSPGPRLELFARQPRLGWLVWGDEVTTG